MAFMSRQMGCIVGLWCEYRFLIVRDGRVLVLSSWVHDGDLDTLVATSRQGSKHEVLSQV